MKRYDCVTDYDHEDPSGGYGTMAEDYAGEWVRYEDALAEINRLRAALETIRDAGACFKDDLQDIAESTLKEQP